MTTETQPQIKEFQAETKQVLAIGHPLAVFAQGDFPSRAHFECIGRVRETAFEALANPDLMGPTPCRSPCSRMPRPAPCRSRTTASA